MSPKYIETYSDKRSKYDNTFQNNTNYGFFHYIPRLVLPNPNMNIPKWLELKLLIQKVELNYDNIFIIINIAA